MRIPSWRKTQAASPVGDETRATAVRMDAEELDALDALFSAPTWLRDLGLASWLLVGVAALLGGLVLLIGATATITRTWKTSW